MKSSRQGHECTAEEIAQALCKKGGGGPQAAEHFEGIRWG